ncbi:hypothetical protein BX257_4740 [Streptomyces sp. 3212.3]|uniref:hypothetical protein n=1 Tax=Streptomyces sp. 3212.3 TaxID=1938846 RepID=UPI000E27889A|nr:hypothetical protein [Streptomyces sp. 3212.3]REE62127.1 hypothetical protein BX257_4740 [Streptomyces sp. 3212.3]
MRRTVYNHVRAKASLAITARTAAANGTTVDRALSGASGTNEWFASAMLLVHTGTITDGTHAITLEGSDDGSSWAAVAAADLQGSLPTIGASDDDKVFEVGYMGAKRYLRAVATPSGTTTGGVYGATILLGFPNVPPISRT